MPLWIRFSRIVTAPFDRTLGTENTDGTIHLTAVWFLFEENSFYIATSSKTKKARNILARQRASLMVDIRKPGTERGLTAACRAELLTGDRSKQLNRRIHSRYLSAAAMADPASSRFSPRLTM